jgi:hypothetical protein
MSGGREIVSELTKSRPGATIPRRTMLLPERPAVVGLAS